MTCCKNTSTIFKIAALLLLFGIILNVIGFAAPFWSDRVPEFEGLWQVCSAGTCSSTVGNALTDDNWFIANQVLQTVGLALALIAVIVSFIFLCSNCILRCFNACGIVIAIHVYLAAIVIVAGLTLYGVQSKITSNSVRYLFSYWLVLVAAVVYFISGILFSLAIDRDWRHDDDDDDDGKHKDDD